jgi:hypothetical protein
VPREMHKSGLWCRNPFGNCGAHCVADLECSSISEQSSLAGTHLATVVPIASQIWSAVRFRNSHLWLARWATAVFPTEERTGAVPWRAV